MDGERSPPMKREHSFLVARSKDVTGRVISHICEIRLKPDGYSEAMPDAVPGEAGRRSDAKPDTIPK